MLMEAGRCFWQRILNVAPKEYCKLTGSAVTLCLFMAASACRLAYVMHGGLVPQEGRSSCGGRLSAQFPNSEGSLWRAASAVVIARSGAPCRLLRGAGYHRANVPREQPEHVRRRAQATGPATWLTLSVVSVVLLSVYKTALGLLAAPCCFCCMLEVGEGEIVIIGVGAADRAAGSLSAAEPRRQTGAAGAVMLCRSMGEARR